MRKQDRHGGLWRPRRIPRAVRAAVLLVPACAPAEASSDHLVTEDLGRVPPYYRTLLEVRVPPLAAPARFLSTASSCGCLEAKLCTATRVVSEDEVVPAGEPLSVKLQFAPKRQKGPESVHLRFEETGGGEAVRQLDLTYTVDAAVSLVAAPYRVTIVADVSEGSGSRTVPLQHALPEGRSWRLRMEPDVASPVRLEASAGPKSALVLRWSSPDTTGELRGKLELPFGDRGFQIVPMTVVAKAPQCVHPVKIVSRIPLGGSLAHPVRLQGPAWEPDPELIEDMEVPRLVVGPQGVTTGDLRVQAAHRGSPGADPSLLLSFASGRVPGVYEGRVLVRPARNTRYRVSIPYTIAVVKME